MVTFRYKESDTGKIKRRTISAEEFIRRFLQHVLPDRFVKVRYYGILSPSNRNLLDKVKYILGVRIAEKEKKTEKEEESESKDEIKPFCCPKCGNMMVLIEELPSKKRGPPKL
jgi:hypothetical protein